MRQVFRLMGMPDKVIAFDELPKDLLEGLEMFDCSRLPKDWREFIGTRERHIRIAPEIDPFTRQRITFPPLVQKAPYAFLIDWEVNSNKERWQEISNYVKRNAPKDFRLMDKIEDMAKPMAADAHSELTLEPEDVVVVPLPALAVEVPSDAPKIVTESAPAPAGQTCDECGKVFEDLRGLGTHKRFKHKEEVKV